MMASVCRLHISGASVCARCRSVRWNWVAHVRLNVWRRAVPALVSSCRCRKGSEMEPLRILVADDHPVFRTGIKALLQAAPEMELVGEATTGDTAVELAAQLQPDVVLMDIKMPGLNGIEATRKIVHTSPQIRVLVVTM